MTKKKFRANRNVAPETKACLRKTATKFHPRDGCFGMAKFARVIADQSGSRAFDYEIPEALASKVQIGSRVQVLVRARPALATVINLLDETNAPGVRPISDVVIEKPLVNPMLIQLGYWMADYYCCS